MGHLERTPQHVGDASKRGSHLGRRHPELVHLHPVEPLGQAPQSAVTVPAHFGEDTSHRILHPVRVGIANRAGQRLLEAVTAVEAAEIDSTETHGLRFYRTNCRFWPAASPRFDPGCHDRPMPSAAAELSSLATALDELTRRVTAHAEAAHAAKQDDTARELFAVERSLTTANRRLARLAKTLADR